MSQLRSPAAVGLAAHERRAVNAKEACQLLHAGADALRALDSDLDRCELDEVAANGVVRLELAAVERLLGEAWEAKLESNPHVGRNRLILGESLADDGTQYVYIDATRLEEVAAGVVTQNEASRMLERRFGGIDRAQRFIADNAKPGGPDFQFSETFMGGFLGDRWRDRLKRSALPFAERHENGQTSVFVAFAPFCAAAERALRSVAARKRN